MSKNFELLRRAGKDEALFGHSPMVSRSNNGARARSEEEIALGNAVQPHIGNTPARRSGFTGLALEETVKLVQRVFLLPNSHAPRAVARHADGVGLG